MIKRGAVGTIKEEYRKENAMDAKGMFKSGNDTAAIRERGKIGAPRWRFLAAPEGEEKGR